MLVTLAVILMGIHTAKTVNESESSVARIRSGYIEKQRGLLKTEAHSFARIIEHERDKQLKEAKTQVRARVSAAHAVAQNIYRQYEETKTKQEIQKLIIDALRPLRLDQGGGYYFIFNFDGVVKLFSDRPEQEQVSLLEKRDTRGKYVVKEMLYIVKVGEEGYYSYHWSKPGQEGNDYKKIAFVKRFEPFDWVIGTGVYLDDLESEMRKAILKYANGRRFGPNGNGYVFVNELLNINGGEAFARVYANPNRPDDTGKPISDDYRDAGGKAFRKEFLKGLREHGECYVDYQYKKIGDQTPSPKTSFFKLAAGNRFIVAAGLYMDDMEERILVMQTDLENRLRNGFLVICVVFFAAVLTVWVLAGLLNKKLENDFRIFAEFFNIAACSSRFIDRKRVRFRELDRLAAFANNMLAQKAEAEKELFAAQAGLTEAQKIARMGHYFYDVKRDQWSNSSELDTVFGIDGAFEKNISGWLEIVHPLDREALSDYLRDRVLARGEKFDREYRIIDRKTGREKWVHGLGDLRLGENREPVEMFGTIQDITERKRVDDALRESEARLSGIVDSLADWVWEVDAGGRYLYCSHKVEKIFGYAPEEMIGKTPFDFMKPEESEKNPKGLQ